MPARLVKLGTSEVDVQDLVHDTCQNLLHVGDVHGHRDVRVQLLVARLVLHELLLDVTQAFLC